ncbi:hypothetical protein CEXT_465141 [Caerostris extrusa]|uniref:Uncharacterized protein n=1 Tax=Caerostris extrusa TaxID=172846 RepID=A0AAV4MDA3_CAEEX|nr:hypothetical protein CEXT_465141 [Caerostris extrusa]
MYGCVDGDELVAFYVVNWVEKLRFSSMCDFTVLLIFCKDSGRYRVSSIFSSEDGSGKARTRSYPFPSRKSSNAPVARLWDKKLWGSNSDVLRCMGA